MTAISPDVILNLRDRRYAGEPLVRLAAEIDMSWQKLWGFLYVEPDCRDDTSEKSSSRRCEPETAACVPVTFAENLYALHRLRQAQLLTAAVGDKGLPNTAWARFQARRRQRHAAEIRFWRKESLTIRKSLGLPPIKWFKAAPTSRGEVRAHARWMKVADATPSMF